MFRNVSFLEEILDLGRKIIPRRIFEFFRPWYHGALAISGAVIFGFPSRQLKVIGVTGSKGKSTTVFLISRFLEEAGHKTAAIGSLGYKIGGKEWPNNLKMTMPGRWKIQKFLARAVRERCKFAVLEITSEGIKQKRHLGIRFDAAVFTNLEKEHIESHGSFENCYRAKQELFRRTKGLHILNADSQYVGLFSGFHARDKIFFKLAERPIHFRTYLIGDFNTSNILAARAIAREYGVGDEIIQRALDKIKTIPGRMEFIEAGQNFKVVVDYAHTPESLIQVYQTLRSHWSDRPDTANKPKLICVLGAAGGGRDKWKRPIFGKIAAKYCDKIILTDEDPYDENPEEILEEIASGFPEYRIQNTECRRKIKYEKILDRREAIGKALALAQKNDIVVITGKGSENSMAVAGGKKIPWSDKGTVLEILENL